MPAFQDFTLLFTEYRSEIVGVSPGGRPQGGAARDVQDGGCEGGPFAVLDDRRTDRERQVPHLHQRYPC